MNMNLLQFCDFKQWATVLLLVLVCQTVGAQTAHRALRKADRAYEAENYEEAEKGYGNALEADNSAQGNYNLGNSHYEKGDYEEAAKRYEEAAGVAEDPNIKTRAYRNLGDAYFQQKDYEKSIDSYKKSLRINPEDEEAKYNLSQALRYLQQQQQQQQQQQNNEQDENQDQENQDQQNGQGQNPQEGENEQNSDGENQQQQQSSGEQSKANPQNAPQMSREEAERQLGIAAEAEKETMGRVQQSNLSGCNSSKEW